MSTTLLSYLETEVFFPVLNTCPTKFPGHGATLVSAQHTLIDILRTMVYPSALQGALPQTLAISREVPSIRSLWTDLQRLGFTTPLDEPVQQACSRMAA